MYCVCAGTYASDHPKRQPSSSLPGEGEMRDMFFVSHVTQHMSHLEQVRIVCCLVPSSTCGRIYDWFHSLSHAMHKPERTSATHTEVHIHQLPKSLPVIPLISQMFCLISGVTLPGRWPLLPGFEDVGTEFKRKRNLSVHRLDIAFLHWLRMLCVSLPPVLTELVIFGHAFQSLF
jgi:hypothetical protein